MPTAAERLRHVTTKVERAKEHIAELEAGIHAYIDAKPYEVSCKRDPQTRRPIYYISRATPVPDRIALIAGDAIQNLISALDHLAFQLVCSDTDDKPPKPLWIYFPIGNDLQDYKDRLKRKMKGALPDTCAAIDALHPYKGRNDALWKLFTLNSADKHRLLFVVGAQAAHINIAPLIPNMMRNLWQEADKPFFTRMTESMYLNIVPADKGFPLKEGFEIYIGVPDEEPNPKFQATFTVAINEPGISQGEPVVELLHQSTALVEGIVSALTPRLR